VEAGHRSQLLTGHERDGEDGDGDQLLHEQCGQVGVRARLDLRQEPSGCLRFIGERFPRVKRRFYNR
jgi:hypothetical protein